VYNYEGKQGKVRNPTNKDTLFGVKTIKKESKSG
jgi:hypothetical protein